VRGSSARLRKVVPMPDEEEEDDEEEELSAWSSTPRPSSSSLPRPWSSAPSSPVCLGRATNHHGAAAAADAEELERALPDLSSIVRKAQSKRRPSSERRPSNRRQRSSSERPSKTRLFSKKPPLCLGIDVFLKLFRLDRDALQPSVVEKMREIVQALPRRPYEPGDVIVSQGDAKAKNELLVFVEGDVHVWSHVFQKNGPPGVSSNAAAEGAAPPPLSKVEDDEDDEERERRRRASSEEEQRGASPEGAEASASSEEQGAPRQAAPRQAPVTTVRAPFYVGEERVLRGSWPTATYRAAPGGGTCYCYVLTERDIAALMLTGGFDLERTLRLRAFERTLAKHGMHVSVLRDAVFVDHFMAYLVKFYAAENLRFMVDLMKLKRDVEPGVADLDVAEERFEAIWDAYFRPWGAMSNVCAVECPPLVVEQIAKARTDALAFFSTGDREKDDDEADDDDDDDVEAATWPRDDRDVAVAVEALLAVLDPAAKRVKKFLELEMLPAFVRSPHYPAFLRERFPLLEQRDRRAFVGNRGGGTTKGLLKPSPSSSPDVGSRDIVAGGSLLLSRAQKVPSLGDAPFTAMTDFRRSLGGLPSRETIELQKLGNNRLALSSRGNVLSARPSLQLKLATMADELNEIERNASQQQDVRRKSSHWEQFRRDSRHHQKRSSRGSFGDHPPRAGGRAADDLADFAAAHQRDDDDDDYAGGDEPHDNGGCVLS